MAAPALAANRGVIVEQPLHAPDHCTQPTQRQMQLAQPVHQLGLAAQRRPTSITPTL